MPLMVKRKFFGVSHQKKWTVERLGDLEAVGKAQLHRLPQHAGTFCNFNGWDVFHMHPIKRAVAAIERYGVEIAAEDLPGWRKTWTDRCKGAEAAAFFRLASDGCSFSNTKKIALPCGSSIMEKHSVPSSCTEGTGLLFPVEGSKTDHGSTLHTDSKRRGVRLWVYKITHAHAFSVKITNGCSDAHGGKPSGRFREKGRQPEGSACAIWCSGTRRKPPASRRRFAQETPSDR